MRSTEAHAARAPEQVALGLVATPNADTTVGCSSRHQYPAGVFKLPGRWRKPPLDFAVISRSLDDALPRLSDLLAANAAAASADVHTLAAPSFTLYSTKPLTDQARPQL